MRVLDKLPLFLDGVCELRHIALPRIDLLCRFSLDCDPSPMTGPFLEKRPSAAAPRTRPCAGRDCPPPRSPQNPGLTSGLPRVVQGLSADAIDLLGPRQV